LSGGFGLRRGDERLQSLNTQRLPSAGSDELVRDGPQAPAHVEQRQPFHPFRFEGLDQKPGFFLQAGLSILPKLLRHKILIEAIIDHLPLTTGHVSVSFGNVISASSRLP
jgi:hypothetical protein